MSAAESVTPEAVILVGGEALFDLVLEDGSEDIRAHPGGGPFNTARTIGRLEQPVAFLGRLSSDRFGTTHERMLAEDAVRLDAVVWTDEPTTLALAEVDASGSARYRFYERGTAAPGLTPETPWWSQASWMSSPVRTSAKGRPSWVAKEASRVWNVGGVAPG